VSFEANKFRSGSRFKARYKIFSFRTLLAARRGLVIHGFRREALDHGSDGRAVVAPLPDGIGRPFRGHICGRFRSLPSIIRGRSLWRGMAHAVYLDAIGIAISKRQVVPVCAGSRMERTLSWRKRRMPCCRRP